MLPLLATIAMANTGLYDFTYPNIDGKSVKLEEYKGKIVIVVNVASKCGQTKQYAALEAMYRKHKGDGLVILGFPCNQFGGQEPGTEADIKAFCSANYNVTFPMFSKIEVNGNGRAPLYKWLIESTDGKDIEWNFAKFIVGRDGKSVARFPSKLAPDSDEFAAAVEAALKG
jgi:glutathione peroxidase